MRKNGKIFSAFLAVLLLLSLFSVTAFADSGSTTLTATVPCTVTLQVGDHGKVTVDGTDYTGNGSFQRDAGTAVTYTFDPNGLYRVDKVIYNGGEVTSELSGNTWTAPVLTGNAALSVSFKFLGGGTPTYTVTFDANGHGTAPAAQTVLSGTTATKPTDPTASGWRFGGWYKEKACINAFDFATPITGDITLFAKWTKTGGGGGITTQYTLTYDTNGGSSIASTKHNSGATVSLTATPTREGFAFTGWYSDAGLTNKITSIKMNGNKTVYAGWKENAAPSSTFTDVPEDAWYKEAVDYVVEKGLMVGTAADKFSPELTTTRAMIVTILYRLEGRPVVTGASPFDDVASGQWYTDAVIWANANGIVLGYGNGKFGPNDLITREQFAAIMYRYANFKGYDTSKTADLSGYTDAGSISGYAVDAMKWANAENLITGRTATTLVPRGEATRAEAAAILMRFIENVK